VRTFPAAIVHTIGSASDALSLSIVKVSRAKVITIEPASDSFVQTKNSAIVQTIEPAKEILSMKKWLSFLARRLSRSAR
jgi:hypothetical protein